MVRGVANDFRPRLFLFGNAHQIALPTKMSAAEEGEGQGGAENRRPNARGDRITQDLQQQARQKDSPVISELLLAAKKGHTEQVVEFLQRDPDKAAITDKVCSTHGLKLVPWFCMHSSNFFFFPSTGVRAYI